MGIKEQVDAVVVSMEVAERPCLFVLLADDGTVNRMGTGAADNVEKALFVGSAPGALFVRFMSRVDEAIFENAGVYKLPEPAGEPCKLELAFRRPGGPVGFEFHFGTEGQGPPPEIGELVKLAIELTEPWYEAEKQKAAAAATQDVEED